MKARILLCIVVFLFVAKGMQGVILPEYPNVILQKVSEEKKIPKGKRDPIGVKLQSKPGKHTKEGVSYRKLGEKLKSNEGQLEYSLQKQNLMLKQEGRLENEGKRKIELIKQDGKLDSVSRKLRSSIPKQISDGPSPRSVEQSLKSKVRSETIQYSIVKSDSSSTKEGLSNRANIVKTNGRLQNDSPVGGSKSPQKRLDGVFNGVDILSVKNFGKVEYAVEEVSLKHIECGYASNNNKTAKPQLKTLKSGAYSIYSANMGDASDEDGDGYARYRKLYFDVDVSSGTSTIYSKIYYKSSSSSSYSLYYTSNEFDITENESSDEFWVALGSPNPELQHGLYDFRIKIFDAGSDQEVASIDASGNSGLESVAFETASEDSSSQISYSIYDVYWEDIADDDGDGYSRYRKFYIDVDVSSGTHTVYTKIYYKLSSAGSYIPYFTIDDYDITEDETGDTWWVAVGLPNSELPHGQYDFKIEVFDASNDTKVASRDYSIDNNISSEKFETADQDSDSAVSYSIYSASMGDITDNDEDGYSSYRKLYLDVDVSTGTHTVYSKVYYKTSSSSTYNHYYTSNDFEITDDASDDKFWIALGAPNPELSHGTYDFKVEIYDAGDDQMVATTDASSDSDLSEVHFETASEDSSQDLNYSIYEVFWTDNIDEDGDAYSQYRKMVLDVDVSSGTHTVYAKVYYKLATASSFDHYFTSDNFEVTDNSSDDKWWIAIGDPNPELAHNSYDFAVEIYDASNNSKVASLNSLQNDVLSDERFETASQDTGSSLSYTVYSASMGDVTDNDGDGYSSYRKLYLDVDVSSGTHWIYAKVYYKAITSSSYEFYYTSNDFDITEDSSDDEFWIAMGSPNPELSFGEYDFKVEIYEKDSNQLVASVDASADSDLSEVHFETAAEDEGNSLNFTVYSASMGDVTDNDGDGYSSYRKLYLDVDVSSGTHWIYAKVYYKAITSSSYEFYYTSNDFDITEDSSDDEFWIAMGSPNPELSFGEYDFKVEIYEKDSNQLVASVDASVDSDLSEVHFETAAEDEGNSLNFTVYSASLGDVTDNDGDGYSSYRKLYLDVDVSSGTHWVYAKVYYKESNSSNYEFYYSSNDFDITENASNDEFWIAMGTPNPELSFGAYDFKVEIYNTENDQLVASVDASADSDLSEVHFETAAQDESDSLNFSIYSAYMGDVVDNDADGYSSYRKLYLDVDVSSGTHWIYAKVYYKVSSSDNYEFYYSSNDFDITDSEGNDAFWIAMGAPNPELSYGNYDFKVEIYNKENDQIVATVSAANDVDLSEVHFETAGQDEDNSPNFTIYSALMDDVIDNDGDGYRRYCKLYLDVDVSSGTHSIYSKVYYKASSSASYQDYYTSNSFEISQNESNDAFWIAIGDPNPELSHGIYDFKVEIYNKENDQLVGTVEADNDEDLSDLHFETAGQDEDSTPNFTVYSALMDDVIDNDGDGYRRYCKLYLDVDVNEGSYVVFTKIYYKSTSSSTYSHYYTSSSFEITTDSRGDELWIAMGAPNLELSHGTYDFKVEVYRLDYDLLVASVDASQVSDLSELSFESASEDSSSEVRYTIHEVSWSDEVDEDGDTYSRYRKLNIDVDASFGTHTVFTKIFYKLTSSSSYDHYYTIDNYEINGDAADDTWWVAVGTPNPELDHGSYDFKVEVYNADSNQLVASLDASENSTLSDKKFETEAQEENSSYSFSIYNTYIDDTVDIDEDGYSSYCKLYIDVDVSSETHTIYTKIFYKSSSSSTYRHYYTSNNFEITGNSSSDKFWISLGAPNPDLPHDSYDFRIEVFDTEDNSLLVSLNASEENNLSDLYFELESEDAIYTGIQKEETQTSIFVYPNPANENLNLKLDGMTGQVKIEIFSIRGQKVVERVEDVYFNEVKIPLQNLSKGMYILRATKGKECIRLPFEVVH